MTDMKLEDPTVDVSDIETYRLAFLMQFFVQHKRRFRFPRLRLQDLYQRVVKHPDAVAFSDLVARILRFLSHGDPDICIDNVDQALDRFAMEKRTPYRINMQRHRNGKPVHQLGPAARAALLDNLIESVYDEQPDFNFAAGFNPPNPIASSSAGRQTTVASSSDTAGAVGSLFGESVANDVSGPDFSDSEEVNVLIKAGQDAQGCSYYYMDDLRLYRERPQSGLCSQWDVAVGPTAAQWQSFIASLSRNEKEYDLYCFLNHDLFELVKQSLDSYELHAPNNELDSCNLRTKEMNELADLRRRKGTTLSKLNSDCADSGQLPLSLSSGLSANGPKSASPAFSGGHGGCGIGSLGSASSVAPLTPSSARTPTSAPPATASNGYSVNPTHVAPSVDSAESSSFQKSEAHTPREENSASWPGDCGQSGVTQRTEPHFQTDPNVPVHGENYVRNACLTDANSQLSTQAQPVKLDSELPAQPAKPSWIQPDGESPNHRSPSQLPFSGTAGDGTSASSWPSPGRLGNLPASVPSIQPAPIHRQPSIPNGMDSRLKAPGSCQLVSNSPSTGSNSGNLGGPLEATAKKTQSPETTPNKQFDAAASSSQSGIARHQIYSFDPSGKDSQDLSEYNNGTVKFGSSLRPAPPDLVDPSTATLECQMPFGPKPPMGPATALVPPMLGIPDCGPALTQEQWENRKSKIAQLEKIHSTLSKSKSASTPGAVTAAAAAAAAAGNGGGTFPQRAHPNGPTTPTHGLPSSQSAPGYGPGASCQPIQRQTTGDSYYSGRPVLPSSGTPVDPAQRDWDRMCMDYQRDRSEPLGTRFHPSFRQPIMSDPGGCPVVPPDAPMSPLGTPVGPLMSTDTSPCPPGRQYSDGPPVMMVPPNNSNFTMVSSAYSPSSLGPQHYRYPAPLVHSEQGASVLGPNGQKRVFYGPTADPWFSPYNNGNNGSVLVSTPASDAGCAYAGPLSSVPAVSGPRFVSGPLGTVNPAPTPSGPPNSSNPIGPAPGRPTTVGKVGGKKRKTVSSARVTVAATPVNHPSGVPSSQQIYPYGKTAAMGGGPSSGNPITPGKPSYSSPYALDPSTPGYHPHRSMYISSPGHPHMVPMCAHPHANFSEVDPCFGHYPDMLGSGSTVSRSVNPAAVPVDGRRALTPKGTEVCPVGPMGPNMPCNAQGRIQPNCGPMYPGNGSFGTNSVASPYMLHPSDMPGPIQDSGPGLRPAASCTQHLTSASLASLARLSQLSGPEGPYGSPASSAPIGSGNIGMTPGVGSYPNRPSHSENPTAALGLPQQMPPQAMRGHPGSYPVGMKMHEADVPSSLMYSKFGPHVYHGSQPPTLPATQPSVQGPSHNQHQSQQPPSIQVNNTFFNAQLNVQQMNYQHVTAPGSTGQMQIHFVQQQQQQQQGDNITTAPVHGNRPSRPPDSASRMGTAVNNSTGPDYYAGPNSTSSFGPEPPSMRSSSYGSQVVINDTPAKPEVSTASTGNSPAVSASPASAGYGNTSIQITPRTPHTIQYLPAVVPAPSEPQSGSQQVYPGGDSVVPSRSRPGRVPNGQYNNCPPVVQFNPNEAPELGRTGAGTTFNSSGPPNMGHPTTHAMSQQVAYQSQYAAAQQQTGFSTPQPTGGSINRPNPQTTGSGWLGSPQSHMESNSCTVLGGAGFPDQLTADAVSAGGRHFANQPSCRAPPSYTSDSMIAVTEAQWPGDNSGSAYPHHRGPQSYNRQQPTARSEAGQQSAVHSHTYRQQQQQHYQQQSSQQHQMFMSSSVGSFGDSNQVQFMMSASSSTSAQSSSTTNLVSMNTMPPESGSVGRGFGPVGNQNPDLKCESQSDPASGLNSKRVSGIHSVGQDDPKPNHSSVCAPHPGAPAARSHWTNSDQYSTAFQGSAGFPGSGSLSVGANGAGGSGPSVAYFDPSMNGREMLTAQQSAMCDMPPPSMQQTFSSSVLP